MKACQHPGVCKLCGELKPLTFEHVPPKHAFNSFPVMYYSFDEAIKIMAGADGRKPWDFEGLKGKKHQAGSGAYYLCRSCNSNTGSWYDRYKEHTPFGVNISSWANYSYDEKCNIEFIGIPYIELNSQIPTDFRSREEIENCIKKSSLPTM